MIDKSLIQKRFSNSLLTYDSNASVQQLMADQLILMLTKYLLNTNPLNIFEIGCGTGNLTKQITQHLPIQQLTINDLVPQCQKVVEQKIDTHSINHHFLFGDAESLTFPTNQDLIISASTIQWFQNLDDFFIKCANSLVGKGCLALGSFGPENFKEIKQCTQKGIHYLSLDEIITKAQRHFKIIEHKETLTTLQFTHPIDVLKHIKNTGVNSFGNNIWTKEKLNNFVNQYQKLFSEKSVQLTYHPLLLILEKR